MIDKNWIRVVYRSIGYPIEPPSNVYEENQATIKRVLEDRVKPQCRPIDVLVAALHELHLRKTFYIVDTRSNMYPSGLKSKPHVGESLSSIIGCGVGVRFNPPPGSEHKKLLCLKIFYISIHHQVQSHDKPDEK